MLAPLLIFFLAFASSCSAQATTFQWQFANNFVSTSLVECQNMSIVVKSHNNDNTTFGVPPYYFRAIAVGGIPTVTLAGSNINALNWVVDQPAGSKLLVSMIDSNGSSGGVDPILYGVSAGTNTSCLPPAPTSQFTVKANVSTSVQTCQPWGMTIKGGVQPYTVTLAALDSPIITNVTLGPLDDVFTFIDRADPNTQLAAAISDANGTYANGTGLVSTTGSGNVDCTGLVSSSGNSTQMAAQAAAQQAASRSRASARKRKIIAGVVVGLLGLVFIMVAILWCMSRRRRAEEGIIVGQDTRPRLFEVEQAIPVGQHDLSGRKGLLSYPTSPSGTSQLDISGSSSSGGPSSGGEFHPNQLLEDPSQFPAADSSAGSGGRSKALSVYMRATRSVGEVLRPLGPRQDRRGHVNPDAEPDIIIQHRDGGVVQELPPPYADRSRRQQ